MITPPPRRRLRKLPRVIAAVALALGLAGGVILSRLADSSPQAAPLVAGRPAPFAPPASAPPPSSFSSSIPPPDFASVLATGERGDYVAAIRLARALPEDQRPVAIASLFGRWAAKARLTPAGAALALSPDSLRDTAWRAVVHRWASADPAGLAAYARDLPPGPPRHLALEESVRHWLSRDRPAAIAWVETLPSSIESDVAVAVVAQHPAIIEAQPDLAIAWAEAIQVPAVRSRILGNVIREWRESDLTAAEAYARVSLHLTASEREDILVGERFTDHP